MNGRTHQTKKGPGKTDSIEGCCTECRLKRPSNHDAFRTSLNLQRKVKSRFATTRISYRILAKKTISRSPCYITADATRKHTFSPGRHQTTVWVVDRCLLSPIHETGQAICRTTAHSLRIQGQLLSTSLDMVKPDTHRLRASHRDETH